MSRQLVNVADSAESLRRLQADVQAAQAALAQAERELSAEQAAVNRFRMHCRLKIGAWVDQVLALREEKVAAYTRLQLLRQADELGIPYDENDPFWQSEAEAIDVPPPDDGVLLPTDVPRDKAAEKRLYRELARRFHPDRAATAVDKAYATTLMVAVNNAYAQGDIDSLRDLAGELDPGVMAQLNRIESPQVRRLQERLLTLNRRRRRTLQAHQALRQENTAILWRKAEQIEAAGQPWWEAVRVELMEAISRMQSEVAELEAAIVGLSADDGGE